MDVYSFSKAEFCLDNVYPEVEDFSVAHYYKHDTKMCAKYFSVIRWSIEPFSEQSGKVSEGILPTKYVFYTVVTWDPNLSSYTLQKHNLGLFSDGGEQVVLALHGSFNRTVYVHGETRSQLFHDNHRDKRLQY